jgi:hypothetical protein
MKDYTALDSTFRHGAHDSMISLSRKCQSVMEYIPGKDYRASHSGIRAVDFRHIILLMPFIMQDLITPEVQKWNERNEDDLVEDPSNDLVDILCEYIEWYQCFRQRAHTATSVVNLREKGISLIRKCDEVFPRTKKVQGNLDKIDLFIVVIL